MASHGAVAPRKRGSRKLRERTGFPLSRERLIMTSPWSRRVFFVLKSQVLPQKGESSWVAPSAEANPMEAFSGFVAAPRSRQFP